MRGQGRMYRRGEAGWSTFRNVSLEELMELALGRRWTLYVIKPNDDPWQWTPIAMGARV